MPDPAPTLKRVDGSMSLLVDMTEAALDPAYAAAAQRKHRPDDDRPPRAGRPFRLGRAVGLLLVLGLLTGVATAQVRRSAGAADAVRRSLVADVNARTADTDRLAAQVDDLRAQVAQARDIRLGEDDSGRQLAARLTALELATGQTRVTGPGLVVTLDDAPDADSSSSSGRGGQLGDGRIYDRDLQEVANALWAAGAEAISVNGQRLTALTAIRSAGEAVLVDFRPLAPPYRLSVIGDVDRLEPAFADSPTARRFTTYTSLYGLGFDVDRAPKLTLPAAAPPELHVAREAGSPRGGTP
ncbi:MAG: DUF881 domain-containing protein [Mycobacteriales bacterium]